CFPLTELDYW
nr:immunoglobulin heavy chain junction region [Mus musculus]